MNKKSQSAMEYLMTYGWAILVVLIALGALFYLGVFSPKTPPTCIVSSPLTCIDVKAVDATAPNFDYMAVSVASTGTSSATLGVITLSTPSGTTCLGNRWDNANVPTTATTTRTCTPVGVDANPLTLTKGQKFSGTVTVTYTPTGGTSHTVDMQVSGTVE